MENQAPRRLAIAAALLCVATAAANAAQVSAPRIAAQATPATGDAPRSVAAFGPRKTAAAPVPSAQDPQKWYPLQPAIPCNTTGLLTPGQYDAAWRACSDRAFNVEHSG